jgi:hypothetical protein
VGHALHRLIETEPGLDAHHEEIERVGKRQAQPVLPALRHPGEHHARQYVPDRCRNQRGDDPGAQQKRQRCHRKERQCAADAHPDEQRQRFLAAVAGGHEPATQFPDFGSGPRRRPTDAHERIHQALRQARLVGRLRLSADHFVEALLDGRRARRQRACGGRHQQRPEHKRKYGQHGTTPRS